MALNTSKCNHLTTLRFKGLKALTQKLHRWCARTALEYLGQVRIAR